MIRRIALAVGLAVAVLFTAVTPADAGIGPNRVYGPNNCIVQTYTAGTYDQLRYGAAGGCTGFTGSVFRPGEMLFLTLWTGYCGCAIETKTIYADAGGYASWDWETWFGARFGRTVVWHDYWIVRVSRVGGSYVQTYGV